MNWKLVPWIIVAGLILFLGGTCARLRGVQRDHDIAVANHQAALDTTRRHLVGEQQALTRMIEQREFGADDLAEILGIKQDSIMALRLALKDREINHLVSLQELHVSFDSVTRENVQLNRDILTTSRTGEEYRIVTVKVLDDEVIKGDLAISVPTNPELPSEVEFTALRVDPFDITYLLGCSDNVAVVDVQAPPWANMSINPGAVDPDVCNPPQPLARVGSILSFEPGNVLWGVLGGVAGYLLKGWVQK